MTRTSARIFAAAFLVLAGMVSLPLAAWVLDGSQATENLILPVQMVAMALVGAGLARWLVGRTDDRAGMQLLKGAGLGVLAAVFGVVVFWFLLSGLRGA